MSFRGQNVLITGGASGIGRLMALRFARAGAHVVIADHDAQGGERTAAELSALGVRAEAFAIDVRDGAAVVALVSKVHEAFGVLDVLINNAGIVHGGPFEQVPVERHLAIYRVNVEGVVRVTHAFLPDLLRSRRGRLVNIASASGFLGLPNGATYASSKWAVIGLSESLRLELAERGVRNVAVTTVCPSYINTGMFDGVKPPLLMPFLTPDFIVDKIMTGIDEGAPFVKEPFGVKTLDAMKGLLPQRLFDAGAKLLGVSSSMNAWKGR